MPELRVRNMGKRFGAVHALRDANLTVRTGEIVALLGPNGSGKSTLLECVAGLMPCDSGSVQLNGTDWPVHSRRDNLFFLPDGVQPWAEQSAGWLLRWSERAFGNVAAATMQDIRETLGIDALRHRRIGDLSKGQRKRVLLSIALSTPHQFVLMDEPFDGLDVRQTREAIALLRRVMATNRGLVVSIHNMLDAERVADRLTLLQDGSVIAEGTPMELRARAGLSHVPLDDVFLALT